MFAFAIALLLFQERKTFHAGACRLGASGASQHNVTDQFERLLSSARSHTRTTYILVKMQASQRKKRLVKARKKSAVVFFFVFSVHYAIIWHRCCSFSFNDATFWMEPGSLGARQNKNGSRCPELTSSLLCTRTPGSFYE